jgi:hypothetical protein
MSEGPFRPRAAFRCGGCGCSLVLPLDATLAPAAAWADAEGWAHQAGWRFGRCPACVRADDPGCTVHDPGRDGTPPRPGDRLSLPSRPGG